MSEEIFSRELDKFSPVRNFKRYIARKLLLNNSKKFLESNDQLIVFSYDIVSHHINLDGFYEKEELDFIFSWFESLDKIRIEKLFGGNALDVGANIGNHSVYFSNFFKRVISFEPHPRIFKLLELNSELKENIEVHNFGISNATNSSTLFFNNENMGASSLDSKGLEGSSKVSVELKKIDDLNEIGKVTFIKIDVEGHEHEVIKGSERLILRDKPVIMFEQFPSEFCNGSSQTIDLLKTFGYEKFAVMEEIPNLKIKKQKYLSVTIIYQIGISFINIVTSLFLGKKNSLKIKKRFSQEHYQFILALPEWISDS